MITSIYLFCTFICLSTPFAAEIPPILAQAVFERVVQDTSDACVSAAGFAPPIETRMPFSEDCRKDLQQHIPVLFDALVVYGGPLHVPPPWLGEFAAVIYLKLLRIIQLVREQPELPSRVEVSLEEGERSYVFLCLHACAIESRF